MNASNNNITGRTSTILHSLAIPLFFLFFTIFYKPRGIEKMLDMEHASFAFNITILFCIVLLSTSITRVWLYLLGLYRSVTKQIYAAWCVCEMIIAALFSSLYVTLMLKEPVSYFEIAGTAMILIMTSTVYPYIFLWLQYEIYAGKQRQDEFPDEKSLIRFYDEYKKLKLVIAREAVMFIKSEENYVHIHYLDHDKNKKFTLRSSMKALEETLTKHSLVRCHRSYFINPAYIKIVHRNSAGMIVAELNQPDCDSIPISRKYQDIITRLI